MGGRGRFHQKPIAGNPLPAKHVGRIQNRMGRILLEFDSALFFGPGRLKTEQEGDILNLLNQLSVLSIEQRRPKSE